MTEITISELARKIHDLPAGKSLHFKKSEDSDLYGVIWLELFDCLTLFISYYGCYSEMINGCADPTPEDIASWVRNFIEDNKSETVFLMEEREVHPHKHELWGVTFRVSNDDGTTYRTLAISEISLFSSREEAEKWISNRPEGPFDSAFPAKICDEPKAVLIDQWEETVNNEKLKTTGTTVICSHEIEWRYNCRGDNTLPQKLPENEVEYIKRMLCDNYVQGELCYYDEENDLEYQGWWRIK